MGEMMKRLLKDAFPELANEWNHDKNKDSLNSITCSSKKKVWWICGKGHEWENTVAKRVYAKQNCPYCSGRRASPTDNLEVKFPEIAKEWHPTKNGDLTPKDIKHASTQKVWWCCPNNPSHDYTSHPKNRTLGGNGCPYCVNRLVDKEGANSLETRFPELAKEWHPTKNGDLKPSQVVFGTHKKVWWLCDSGHEWRSRIADRTINDQDQCPFCINKLVCEDNCLANVYPDIAKEWHTTKNKELTPYDVVAKSGKRVWWQCIKGHEWYTSVSSRTSQKTNCPICFGANSTSFSEQVLYYYLKKQVDVINRYHLRVDNKKWEIDLYIPKLAVGIEYDGIYFHQDKIKQDQLKNDAVEKAGIKLIRLREKGLPDIGVSFFCDPPNEKGLALAIKGLHTYLQLEEPDIDINRDRMDIYQLTESMEVESSLATTFPNIAKMWDYGLNGKLRPTHFTPRSGVIVWWKCEVGHSWEQSISERTTYPLCPYCNKKRPSPEYNLEVIRPELAKMWHPTLNGELTPKDILPRSNEKYWFICENGHEIEKSPNTVKKMDGVIVCRSCKSIDFLYPELAKEWHPTKNGNLTPENVTIGMHARIWWQCKVGHEWETYAYNRVTSHKKGVGKCPECK
jgi:hypothetical protein